MTLKKWLSAFTVQLAKDGFEITEAVKGKNHVKLCVVHTASNCSAAYVVPSTVNHGGAMNKSLSGAKHAVIAQKAQYDAGNRPAPRGYNPSISIGV